MTRVRLPHERVQALRMMRALTLLTVLMALCFGLVAVGCGEDSSSNDELSDRLGGAGEEDADKLGRYFRAISGLGEVDIKIVEAFNQEDVDAAQKQVDRLHEMGTDSLAVAKEFEGAKLRTLLVDYSESINEVAEGYQTIIDTPESAGMAEFEKLGKDLGRRKAHLAKLDNDLLVALRDVMPADEFEKFEAKIDDLQKRYEDAAGGG